MALSIPSREIALRVGMWWSVDLTSSGIPIRPRARGRCELAVDEWQPAILVGMDALVRPFLNHVVDANPGRVVGVYLYGSGTSSGLRPESDIDLLMLTQRSLTLDERRSLVSLLLNISGWRGHKSQFPEVAGRRPLEVTSLVADDVNPLAVTPRRDFQFGEWMRGELVDGAEPASSHDPDVVVLLATALNSHRVLRGLPLECFIRAVPPALLREAQLALLPDLIGGVSGDERNVLLTLARMLITIESGKIMPKHLAAEQVAPRLSDDEVALLMMARDEYLGILRVDWANELELALSVAQTLRGLILEAADLDGLTASGSVPT